MLKRILISCVFLFTLFLSVNQVWAACQNTTTPPGALLNGVQSFTGCSDSTTLRVWSCVGQDAVTSNLQTCPGTVGLAYCTGNHCAVWPACRDTSSPPGAYFKGVQSYTGCTSTTNLMEWSCDGVSAVKSTNKSCATSDGYGYCNDHKCDTYQCIPANVNTDCPDDSNPCTTTKTCINHVCGFNLSTDPDCSQTACTSAGGTWFSSSKYFGGTSANCCGNDTDEKIKYTLNTYACPTGQCPCSVPSYKACARPDQCANCDGFANSIGDISSWECHTGWLCSEGSWDGPKSCPPGQTCSSSHKCVAGSYSCTGVTPSNATLCTSDDTSLSADTANTVVATCGTPKCEYTCSSGYTLSGGVCTLNAYSCTGATPANAVLCAGDDTGLTADTPKKLVAACTASTKCEYTPVSTAEEDCGLRIFDGTAIVKAACQPTGSTTSPLRIGKNGVVRGIVLVDIADPKASSVRMKTASGIKVIKKL